MQLATDARKYLVSLGGDGPGLTRAQRCAVLALAVAVDYDYFTLHSESRGCAALDPLTAD